MDPNYLAQHLRRDIERGALAPGAVLRQEEIAARFGVSRQPVRQALERLQSEGLAARRADRSLAVSPFDPRDAIELGEIRRPLESLALRLSLPHLRPAIIAKAARVADEMTFEQDQAALEDLDVRFHGLLYGGCGNRRLSKLIEDLRREGRRSYAGQPPGSQQRDLFNRQHRAIVDACMRGDEQGAVAALVEHLSVPRIAEQETAP